MEDNFELIAKTLFGMEKLLANELKMIGAQNVQVGNRMVSFVGDKGFMYKSNLSLRTAIKILKPILKFTASNESELYDSVNSFNWTSYITPDKTISVDSVVNGKIFTHSLYVSQKIKDAIVDRIRTDTGKRPNVDLNYPDYRIHIHIDQKKCTLSLDSSGASLHHRGYRTATNIAPINEVLAAGILLHSGWNGQSDFLDPFCGSGTIAIEAAMIACNIPANVNRKEFAFEKWNDWDENLFYVIEESLLKKIKPISVNITGSDKSPSAIQKAIENVNNANLQDFIQIKKKDFLYSKKINENCLHILTNPPYGERMEGDIDKLYSEIGSTLKHFFIDTSAWIITSNMEAIKHVGLKTSRKIKVINGKLDSRLLNYLVYKGSKKTHKQ